jgi:hypothetical protein
MEHVMTTRTNTRFDEQLAQILTDLDVDLEREQAPRAVDGTDDAQLRDALAAMHRALAEFDISLSWFIDREDRVRLLVAWTEEVGPEPMAMTLQTRSYEYTLSRSEAVQLTPSVLVADLARQED